MSPSDPVEIYVARDSQDAHVAQLFLESRGVSAHVVGDFADAVGCGTGGLGIKDTAPKLWVLPEDAPRAIELIREYESSRSRRETEPETSGSGDAWLCPGCGETVEPAFGVCWNCQSERPAP